MFSKFSIGSVLFQELEQPGAPRILELEDMCEGILLNLLVFVFDQLIGDILF